MSLPIIPAEQRQQEDKGVKAVLLGPSGVGKTSGVYCPLERKRTLSPS